MPAHFSGNPNKIIVSKEEIRSFNVEWPCSELRATRAYWFEFDNERNLVDTDVPPQDDGYAAAALAEDCKKFLFDDVYPEWGIVNKP